MNPIYRFRLSVQEGGDTVELAASPIWADSVSLDSEKESGQEFFRTKLNGKLTFVRDDYAWIMARAFEAEFATTLDISRDGGTTWSPYWYGVFYKTDCEIDKDEQKIIVTPTAKDRYNEVLDGMDKEFDLIQLAPEIVPVKFDKRPMVQVYVPGQSVVGCFLSGMWWEQACEPVEESDTIEVSGQQVSKLIYYYRFYPNAKKRVVTLTFGSGASFPVDSFIGAQPDPLTGPYTLTNGNCTFEVTHTQTAGGGIQRDYALKNNGQTLYSTFQLFPDPTQVTAPPLQVTLTGAGGSVTADIRDMAVYCRYITDKQENGGNVAYPIPYDDMVENNRNYRYCLYYDNADAVIISQAISTTPTQYGIYQPGQYYERPYDPNVMERVGYPVARAAWGRQSIWFRGTLFEYANEVGWRTPGVLKDAYPIYSVISRLLGQISPGVTHQGTSTYSEFLYAQDNPISGISAKLFITPKSNVINSGYDQPAQTAKVTLKQVLDMLRDCFRCYWFIDESNRFRVEHIEYFRKGGSYEDDPVVGVNLLAQKVSRNGKPWAYARDKYRFEKAQMPARYEFGWMDEVTELFTGKPIDILSRFVEQGQIEQVSVAHFTSDIDYMLLNPGEISKDGFALLGAVLDSGEYVLPYLNFADSINPAILQNAYVAFAFLQGYYAFDMPAEHYAIGGVPTIAAGVKRTLVQTLRFPILNDLNLMQLVKTGLGDGAIQKISINLSSRNANATLIYEPE